MDELWYVPEDHPSAPAHLAHIHNDETETTVVTACGWQPTHPGEFISRSRMYARHRYACTACLRHAKRSDLIGQAVRDNRGGRA